MAGITNISTLKTAIGDWMFAAGVTLSATYDQFIEATEAALNYGVSEPFRVMPLRVAEMETTGTLTPDANGEAALPADYLEWRGFVGNGTPYAGLTPMTPGQIVENYGTVYGGVPADFKIVGTEITVRPTTTGTVEIVYYAKIPALTDAAPTNWLITKNPYLYLSGCCFHAALYQGDKQRMDEMGPLFASQANGLRASDRTGRWARSVARVAGPTP